MKVKTRTTVPFQNIKFGECFRCVDSDVVYMRTDSILGEHGGVIDAVALLTLEMEVVEK